MKRKLSIFGRIVLLFFLPVSLTCIYCSSGFLEESTAKVFTLLGQSIWTKADQEKLIKLTNEAKEYKNKHQEIVRENKKLKDKEKFFNTKNLLLENWAKKNGKIYTLNYVKRRFGGRIKIASRKYGIEKELITAVITTEWDPKRNKSKKGAVGPMGLMPATASELDVDPYHEFKNILGGTQYLAKLIKRYKGNIKLALAAYNAGPGNVDRYNGVPPFKETINYVGRVKYIFTYQL